MKNEEMKSALIAMEACIRGAEFNSWRKSFVDKNLAVFDFEDENKLVYTDVHRQYEEEIERRMTAALPAGFDLAQFMSKLPEFMEGPGGKDEEIGKAATTLLEASDFQQFRDMMLFTKREKEESGKQNQDLLKGVGIESSQANAKVLGMNHDAMMELCAKLASNNTEEGWENCLTLDWMKIDKKKVEEDRRKSKNEIYLRGVWTMNLSFVECCDMMFNLSPRRKEWDPNYCGVRSNLPFPIL